MCAKKVGDMTLAVMDMLMNIVPYTKALKIMKAGKIVLSSTFIYSAIFFQI